MKKLGWLKLRLHLEQPFIVYIPYEFIKNIVIYHPELGFKGNHQFVSYVLISPSVEKHHDLGTLFKKDTKCLDGFVNFNRRSDKVRSKIICQNFKPGRHQFVEIWHWRNIFYFLIKRFFSWKKKKLCSSYFWRQICATNSIKIWVESRLLFKKIRLREKRLRARSWTLVRTQN